MNIQYIRSGVYYIPDLKLPGETRPIGKWGRMHREYLNEQAQERLDTVICQMQIAEGVTEALKAGDPMAWVQRMNSIRARAEEIVREELIYV